MVFRSRNKDEWEGWWEPVPGSGCPRLHGKVEWDTTRDGSTQISLLVKDLDLPDGAELDVVGDGQVALRTTVSNGSARTTIRSSDGYTVPRLAGQAVELQHRGTVLGRTVLERD